MKTFNIDKCRNNVTNYLKELLENTPEEYRLDMVAFISMEVVILGANSLFEGIGIFEVNKQDYINICDEVLSEEDNTCLN
jgi:hypothetical protein